MVANLLFQVEFEMYSWLIGLALVFGLSFIFNTLLKGNYKSLILLTMAFTGVIVASGLLPEWTLVLVVICTVAVLFMNRQGVDG